jgi:hypothetical protein
VFSCSKTTAKAITEILNVNYSKKEREGGNVKEIIKKKILFK